MEDKIVWKKIKFERTIKTFKDEQTLSVEVSIEKNENYIDSFNFVKSAVNQELGIDCEKMEDKKECLKKEIEELERKKQKLSKEIEAIQNFHRKAANFLEKVGFDLTDVFNTFK